MAKRSAATEPENLHESKSQGHRIYPGDEGTNDRYAIEKNNDRGEGDGGGPGSKGVPPDMPFLLEVPENKDQPMKDWDSED